MRLIRVLTEHTAGVGLLCISLAAAGTASGADLAIVNVALYPSPDAERIDRATVIIEDGRITRVGESLDTGDLPVLDGGGHVATAGLWNSHVHFIDPSLADDPQTLLRDMLLRYGFTSVVDTGSELQETSTPRWR